VEKAMTNDRNDLGRNVRDVWVAWASRQLNPKPSWLVQWDGLDESDREVDRQIGEALYARGAADIAARDSEIAELTQQVSRLTEALRGIYATKVRRSGGSFGFNIKFNGIYSRELSDLIYLTPPAARQGEKEKP